MTVIQKKHSLHEFLFKPLFSCFLISKNLLALEKPSPSLLRSDCLYACVLDALWVSERKAVRAIMDAKFKSHQGDSHKLPSMQC